jgi:hypothetical protein
MNNTQTTTQKIYNVLKWIFAVLFLLSAISVLTKAHFLAFIAFALVGLLLLPPLNPFVVSILPFLIKRPIKIGLVFALLVVAGIGLPKSDKINSKVDNDKSVIVDETVKFPSYKQSVDQRVNNLTPTQKIYRDSILKAITTDHIYSDLVTNQTINLMYVPFIQIIGELFKNYYKEGTSAQQDVAEKVDALKGLDLYSNLIRLENNGGVPYEFAPIIDQYVTTFGYTGNAGDVKVDANGNSFKFPHGFNLAFAKLAIDPTDKKAMDGVGYAFKNKDYEWADETTNDNTFHYPYLNFKSKYIAMLQRDYPDSKFIPNYDIEISAPDLYAVYKENEVVGDKKYKGKVLAVTGYVENISKDFTGNAYVVLNGGQFLEGVHCTIKNEDVAANIRKGSKVTLIGKCSGMIITSVVLKDCDLQ